MPSLLTLEEAEDGFFQSQVKSCLMVLRVAEPLRLYNGESKKTGQPYTRHSLNVEDDSQGGPVDIVDFADKQSGRSRIEPSLREGDVILVQNLEQYRSSNPRMAVSLTLKGRIHLLWRDGQFFGEGQGQVICSLNTSDARGVTRRRTEILDWARKKHCRDQTTTTPTQDFMAQGPTQPTINSQTTEGGMEDDSPLDSTAGLPSAQASSSASASASRKGVGAMTGVAGPRKEPYFQSVEDLVTIKPRGQLCLGPVRITGFKWSKVANCGQVGQDWLAWDRPFLETMTFRTVPPPGIVSMGLTAQPTCEPTPTAPDGRAPKRPRLLESRPGAGGQAEVEVRLGPEATTTILANIPALPPSSDFDRRASEFSRDFKLWSEWAETLVLALEEEQRAQDHEASRLQIRLRSGPNCSTTTFTAACFFLLRPRLYSCACTGSPDATRTLIQAGAAYWTRGAVDWLTRTPLHRTRA